MTGGSFKPLNHTLRTFGGFYSSLWSAAALDAFRGGKLLLSTNL